MSISGPRGVTVSTLDSESSDRGSNPREAFSATRSRAKGGEGGGVNLSKVNEGVMTYIFL